MSRILESFLIFWVPQANVAKIINHRMVKSALRKLELQEVAIRLKHEAAGEAEWGAYLANLHTQVHQKSLDNLQTAGHNEPITRPTGVSDVPHPES